VVCRLRSAVRDLCVELWRCFSAKTLDISNKLSLSSVRSRYLSRISSEFAEQHEYLDGGLVQYAYTVLRSADSDAGLLDLFVTYLRNSNSVCFTFTISAGIT